MSSYTRLTNSPEMVEVATSALTGWALRFAVAMAEGLAEEITWAPSEMNPARMCMWTDNYGSYDPDRCWEIGGPLIEKYKVWLSPPATDPCDDEPLGWDAEIYDDAGNEVIGHAIGYPTALEAVCAAVVLSKFRDAVLVPAELVAAVQS